MTATTPPDTSADEAQVLELHHALAAEQEGLGPEARLFFITHDAKESAVQATVHDLRELPSVRSVDALLRVVGPA